MKTISIEKNLKISKMHWMSEEELYQRWKERRLLSIKRGIHLNAPKRKASDG